MSAAEENRNPVVHEKTFRVEPEMIDLNRHLNNVWPVMFLSRGNRDLGVAFQTHPR